MKAVGKYALSLASVSAVSLALIAFSVPSMFEYEVHIRVAFAIRILREGFNYIRFVAQPPLSVFLEAFLLKVGVSVQEQQLFSIAYSISALAAFYMLVRREEGEEAALKKMLLLGFHPLFLIYSGAATAESLSLMLLLLFFYAYYAGRRVCAAVTLFTGTLTNYTFWLLTPLMFIDGARGKTAPLYYAAGGAAGIFVWGAVNFFVTGNPLHFALNMSSVTRSIYGHIHIFDFSGFEILLPLVAYPLALTFPFSVDMLKRPRLDAGYLFTIMVPLSNAIGVAISSVMPWARYAVYYIPLQLALSRPPNIRRRHLITYFCTSAFITAIHVYWSVLFIEQMLKP
jgi:hypothetical protein